MKKNASLFKIIFFTAIAVIFASISILSKEIKISYANGVQYITPQVLIVLDNSQSMDGDLSGAIMTGSGTVTQDNSSSSPIDYTVPAGFVAPVTGTTTGNAAYTVNQNGEYLDNSASRLNVAKEAIMAVYNEWASDVQFGLMDYGVSGSPSVSTTWVYYMSGSVGFEFGSSATPPSGLQTVPNPCYQQTYTACNDIKSIYSGGVSYSDPYLYIQDTSDEPTINDVLYAGAGWPVNFVNYSGPHPSSPYPPNYSLTNYNNGTISESYSLGTDGTGGFSTSPTNAGYVPYSPQVWYSERGFGYYNNVTNKGDLVIPIAVSASVQQTLFSQFLAPETNNSNTSEIKADAVNAPMAGTLASALSYLTGSGGFPSLPSTTCPAKKYVIFVTDGLPTYDQNGKNWPPIGSAAAAGYGVTATFNADGSLAATNDTALSETIQEISNLKAQGIDTYVIGLGAGVNPSLNPEAAAVLQAMAVAGGTSNYFPATTSADVANDMGIIVQAIVSSGSYVSPVIDQTPSKSGNYAYYANFESVNQPLWGDGNIFNFTLNSQGQLIGPSGPAVNANGIVITSDSYWDSGNGAGGALQNKSSDLRHVITSDINTSTGSVAIIPFSISNDTNLETLLGLTSTNYTAVCPSSASESACADDIINFVLDPGESTNNWKLGAIYHSQPVFIGPPAYPYSSASYQAFKSQYATRSNVLVAGANDGMLHGFDAGIYGSGPGSTSNTYGYGTGGEIFGYIPPDFLNEPPVGNEEICPTNNSLVLPKITCWYELSLMPSSTNFDTYYPYFEFVDSTPGVSDVFFGNIFNGTTNSIDAANYPISTGTPANSWHTVLIGGERSGGYSYFALGLSNPPPPITGNTYPDPLWDFSDAAASTAPMGNTWSQPFLTYVCLPNPNYNLTNGGTGLCQNNPNPANPLVPSQYIETYAAFLGGGYSSNNTAGQAVYALYAEPNPVNTGTSGNQNYVDEQELWKFDGANDSNMKYSIPSAIAPYPSYGELQAFYVGDLGGQMWAFNIPNGTPPYAANGSSNWTGCRVFASDQTASPLDIFFPPSISSDNSGNVWLYFGTGNRADLTEMNSARNNELIGLNTAGTQGIGECAVKGQTNYPYNETDLTNETGISGIGTVTSDGWYITLSPGEKVVSSPTVYDGIVYFDTYIPSAASNACGLGTAKLYALYYLNGGGTITTSGGTVIISNTVTGGGAAQSLTVGSAVPSAPVISNGNLIVTTSTGAVLTQKIPSMPSKIIPTSWFQLP
jgi:type IV pilus assembly protein PilY1